MKHKIAAIFTIFALFAAAANADEKPRLAKPISLDGVKFEGGFRGKATKPKTATNDEELAELVGRVPSQASEDFGVPFKEIFDRYEGDFYKIDPLLFSPAKVTLVNLNSGHSFAAGEIRDDILQQSFFA